MPPPPSSASPNVVTANPFLPAPRLEKPRLDEMSQHDVVDSWRKTLSKPSRSTTLARDVLTSVNANIIARPSPRLSFPKPPPVPDVFAPSPTFTSRPSNGSKRSRDSFLAPSTSTSKRVKINPDSVVEITAKNQKAEEEKWRMKWKKAFPTLVFHFEIGADDGPGKIMKSRILKMGAKIDQFFSTKVTHLIVKGNASPIKPRVMAPPVRKADPVRESPMNPFLDNTGLTDLAQKAEAMNIKVWTVKKLGEMLSRLLPVASTANDSLSHLLEDERLHGTRERDLSAPRPDYYYFKPGSKFLLVEDATGKHRTVMVKEYTYNLKEGPEWPVLYSGFLRQPIATQSSTPIEKLRERAWSLYVDREEYDGEQPPAEGPLRRSVSLRSIPGTPKLPDSQPYQNASGNSVVLTSNIASTSAANGTPNLPGGLPSLGANKDRAIMQMSKRVQVLKGNARLVAKTLETASSRRASTGQPMPPPKSCMTQDQVVKMLRQAREPAKVEPIPVKERLMNRERVEEGSKGRDQDTAAGYCENCRVRYNDLSVHIASRKHRRFAENEENFADLDRLLFMLRRPIMRKPGDENRLYPCNERHEGDSDCDRCIGHSDGEGSSFCDDEEMEVFRQDDEEDEGNVAPESDEDEGEYEGGN
ncbi:regulatory subunit for Cdc7p protein kinase, partial [Tremellales sp. Uapishka_1]